MFNDVRWATNLLRFCTQILCMTLLYKIFKRYILFGLQFAPCLFVVVCFLMHDVCFLFWFFPSCQNHFEQIWYLSPGWYLALYPLLDTCVGTGLSNDKQLIIDNIPVSKIGIKRLGGSSWKRIVLIFLSISCENMCLFVVVIETFFIHWPFRFINTNPWKNNFHER